jgi:hypothetical protein
MLGERRESNNQPQESESENDSSDLVADEDEFPF